MEDFDVTALLEEVRGMEVRIAQIKAMLSAMTVSPTYHLPVWVVQTVDDITPLCRAMEQGYVTAAADGLHLCSHFGTKALLVYFCARLWAGDYAKVDRYDKRHCWRKGRNAFPAKSIEEVFGESGFKSYRNKRCGDVVPDRYSIVDSLFV